MKVPVGREDIARLFRNAVSCDRLCQAYILYGDEGIGKKTLFSYIASVILCDSSSSCGECLSCKSFEKNSHPDIARIVREEDKASIGVKDVRDIKSEVYTRPTMSKYKVVVMHEAHLATTEAQNAMLKMIEEPPERVVFFLLCDTLSTILPTILSRCVEIELKPLGQRDMQTIFGDSAEDFEISLASGNPGKLIKLMSDTQYTATRDEVIDAFSLIASEDNFSAYLAAARLDKIKDGRDKILGIMLSVARDVYFRKMGLDREIINKDKINYIDSFCTKLTDKACFKIAEIIIDTQNQKGKNGNFLIAMTLLLLKCRSEISKK